MINIALCDYADNINNEELAEPCLPNGEIFKKILDSII
jgi:hypothetical protein